MCIQCSIVWEGCLHRADLGTLTCGVDTLREDHHVNSFTLEADDACPTCDENMGKFIPDPDEEGAEVKFIAPRCNRLIREGVADPEHSFKLGRKLFYDTTSTQAQSLVHRGRLVLHRRPAATINTANGALTATAHGATQGLHTEDRDQGALTSDPSNNIEILRHIATSVAMTEDGRSQISNIMQQLGVVSAAGSSRETLKTTTGPSDQRRHKAQIQQQLQHLPEHLQSTAPSASVMNAQAPAFPVPSGYGHEGTPSQAQVGSLSYSTPTPFFQPWSYPGPNTYSALAGQLYHGMTEGCGSIGYLQGAVGGRGMYAGPGQPLSYGPPPLATYSTPAVVGMPLSAAPFHGQVPETPDAVFSLSDIGGLTVVQLSHATSRAPSRSSTHSRGSFPSRYGSRMGGRGRGQPVRQQQTSRFGSIFSHQHPIRVEAPAGTPTGRSEGSAPVPEASHAGPEGSEKTPEPGNPSGLTARVPAGMMSLANVRWQIKKPKKKRAKSSNDEKQKE